MQVRNDTMHPSRTSTHLEWVPGNTTRHRLNRGGDRRLNRAINTIVLTRMRIDPRTRAYIDRRRAEGKTNREIRRALKRYVTRQLYRTLNNQPTPQPLDAT